MTKMIHNNVNNQTMLRLLCLLFCFFSKQTFSSNSTSFVSFEVEALSETLIRSFCIYSRVGGPKCANVSTEYRYGVQDYIDSLGIFDILHIKSTI